MDGLNSTQSRQERPGSGQSLGGRLVKALQQLQDRGYADKYRAPGAGPIHLIGVAFSKDQRNIVAFDTETLP